jgi:hypothetical protein
MMHPTALMRSSSSKRVIFTDNFYTRHTMASTLKDATDGEAQMIGTVRFNVGDAVNRIHIREAMECLNNLQRGSWRLVRAYSKPSDWDHRKAFYLKNHPEELVCENAGYLV